MRTLLIATAGVALIATGGADAQQRVVAHGPGTSFGMPGHAGTAPIARPPMINPGVGRPGGGNPGVGRPGMGGHPPMVHPGRPRWGSKVGGHWWGGVNAPGGWNAYRRPYRGWAVPNYWISPRFYITDWQSYGLTQPSYGYNWVRYYDDAVLIDSRGSVYDSVDGLDWDQGDDGYYSDDAQVYATPADRGYGQSGYVQGYDQRGYDASGYERRDNGVGGAVTGAVVGGVAGNLIAGRGNRLGGTLIGAGVGAAAGYAIDKNEDRHRSRRVPVAPDRAPPPPGDYAPPPAYAPPPPVAYAPPPARAPNWVSADGTTTVTTTSGGGYARGGYYYPGASTTTVVVQTAPVVTTTTTEIYEDAVTYTRPATKRVKRVWRPRPAPRCACR